MQPIFLIVGGPGVGKSTTSRALASTFPRSIHIPVDDLRHMVVSGLELPVPEPVWKPELVRQVRLARETATRMALDYAEAGRIVAAIIEHAARAPTSAVHATMTAGPATMTAGPATMTAGPATEGST